MVPDIRATSEEIRKVNDFEVLATNFKGTMNGTQHAFFDYYYSGSVGTVQFLS